MLRFIGDSHVSVFGGKDYMQPTWPNIIDSGADPSSIRQNLIKDIEQYRLGPQTAFNFHKILGTVKNVLDICDIENDTIFFSAGEIDIREHIIRVANKDKISNETSVINTVDSYFGFLDKVKILGYKVGVLRPHLSFCDLLNSEKNDVASLFNQLCKDLCVQNGYYDIGASDFITQDESFYFDGLHLSQKCIPFFLEQLKSINLYE